MSSFNTFLSITKWAVPETRRLPDLCTVIALSRNNSLFSPIRQSSSTGPNPINLKKSTLLTHHNRSLFPPLYSSGLSTSTNAHSKNMALSNEDAAKACVPPPAETEGFFFQQTMIRIKDPTRSLDFYSRVMGMTLLLKLDFPEMEFSLYFMGYEKPEDVPTDPKERAKFCFSRKATLELTHNHGTEKEENEVYHNGNSDPRGFGHIGIVVPDVYKASERFEKLGVPFVKKPDAGKMKGLAFIKDPDGYWIEILNPTNMAK